MQVASGCNAWGSSLVVLTNRWWIISTTPGLGFSPNTTWFQGILTSTISVPLFKFFIVLFFEWPLKIFVHIVSLGWPWSFSLISPLKIANFYIIFSSNTLAFITDLKWFRMSFYLWVICLVPWKDFKINFLYSLVTSRVIHSCKSIGTLDFPLFHIISHSVLYH